MGKRHPYYEKSMSIDFPDFPHTMGFVAFSCNVENLWRNPYISHMLKYNIGWELDGKKAPMLWEKYGYGFPRLSPYHGLCTVENLWGNPYISHMLKYIHRLGIGWEKSTHAMGKVWLSISQTYLIPWVLLHFPAVREMYGETHAFPIWWHRLILSCASQSIEQSKSEGWHYIAMQCFPIVKASLLAEDIALISKFIPLFSRNQNSRRKILWKWNAYTTLIKFL